MAKANSDSIILAGDTVVACGRRILPKCERDADVRACLQLLSGRRHKVFSGVSVVANGKVQTRVASSAVAFKRLSADEMDAFIKTGEGIGKAGGYALQGHAAAFITFMSGTPSTIIGLPLYETAQLLKAAGHVTHP